jgi:NitT/TauT family transport system substrate-binding protein
LICMTGRRTSICVRTFALALLIFALASVEQASAAPKLRIGVLQFGTFSWLLDTIRHNGFDKAEGIKLDVMPLASTEATKVGLESGSLDIIASDWLWVSRERSMGANFTFSPFSTELGAVMVPRSSPIKTLDDLKGKKIGVAGGPLDKSWLMLVAYALRVALLDLRTATTPVYGAPPFLAEMAERHEIDAVLEYWPYAARLEAKGFTKLIGMDDLALELGARGKVSVVGYVFSQSWAKANPASIAGFLRAAAKANELLATSDAEWQRIRPLMRAPDDATFEALKRHYRDGIPDRSVASNEADAKILYQFLHQFGGDKLVGTAPNLVPGTFWNSGARTKAAENKDIRLPRHLATEL